jgi:hypothetical protein
MSNKLWSVTYDNKYGQDTSIFSTEANAYLGACCIIMEWIHEVDDDEWRQNLKSYFLAGEYQLMVESWGEYQAEFGSESLTVGEGTAIDAGILNAEKLREIAAKPEGAEEEALP